MSSPDANFGKIGLSALTFSLLATGAEARCGPDKTRPETSEAITRCITIKSEPSFLRGMGVGATELLKTWGFTVTDNTLEHPTWGKVSLGADTTEGVWSWHRDTAGTEGELPSVRIFVKNKDNSLTILDIFQLNGQIHHSLQKITIPPISQFTR